MKFLCGNCKAKYQIADDKASGRTLRMKCRRCGHDILIDGHTMPAASAPPPAPAAPAPQARQKPQSMVPAPRAGSGVGPHPPRAPVRPSTAQPGPQRSKPPAPSLSQDFRRHLAAPPEVPQRTSPYDLWHVAIQDVPVGPMTRDELGRKIDSGAVTADSLCWREGMDDWRPLGELPEVSQLLRRPARPEPRSQRPPRPRVPPPVVPAPTRANSVFPAGDFEEVDDEGSEPTRIADITGGLPSIAPAVVAPAPQHTGTATVPRTLQPQPSPAQSQPLAVSPVPGDISVAAPMPRGQGGMSGSTGLALGLLVGILLVGGPILYRNIYATPQQPTAQAAALPQPEKDKVAPLLPAELEADGEPAPEVAEKTETKPRVGGTGKTKTESKAPPKDNLTDEQRKLLERMGGGGASPNIREDRDAVGGSKGGPALTASQLTSVVQNNKVQLQRCYESALRAAGGRQDGAIKITVAVNVGESGTVKSVSTKGTGLGNMTECMKTSVKRWRFPQSGGESEFEFPLVFQPGA